MRRFLRKPENPTDRIALAAAGISLFPILVRSFFGMMAEQMTGCGIIADDSGGVNISRNCLV